MNAETVHSHPNLKAVPFFLVAELLGVGSEDSKLKQIVIEMGCIYNNRKQIDLITFIIEMNGVRLHHEGNSILLLRTLAASSTFFRSAEKKCLCVVQEIVLPNFRKLSCVPETKQFCCAELLCTEL